MNAYKEWMISHEEDCEYCNRVSESWVFSESKKSDLIAEHTTDALNNYGDMLHDLYREGYL